MPTIGSRERESGESVHDIRSAPSRRPATGAAGAGDEAHDRNERFLRDVLSGTLPLSQAPPGLRVRVEKVLFDVPRNRCAELGIEPEAVLRCMAWLPDAILVQRPDGQTARIDVALADFVSVRPEHSEELDTRGHGHIRRREAIDSQRGAVR